MQEWWQQIKTEVKKGMMALTQATPLTESRALLLLLGPLRELEIQRFFHQLDEPRDKLRVIKWQIALIKVAAANAVSDAEKDKILVWTFPYQVWARHWRMAIIREGVSLY